MKRLVFAVMAIMLMATPVVNAQKVNKEALLAKLEKADADSKNEKKATKAATWIARGKAYYEAASAPVKDIFPGMEMQIAEISIGKATSVKDGVVLGGQTFAEHTYPWFKLYVAGGKIAGWELTQRVKDVDLAAIALESFNKAYELDAKQANAINDGLQKLQSFYSQNGNAYMEANNFGVAADNYLSAYKVQESPAFSGKKDAAFLYYAGYLYVVAASETKDKSFFPKGVDALNKALAAGYNDEAGDIYYYLYHGYYGQEDSSVRQANLERAKQVLMEGLAKFPENINIINGLINVYSSGSVGNISDLTAMVDAALARDPKSRDLWYGRGQIFFNLKNYDESIASFKKVVELDPKDGQSMFYIGFFYITKADAMNDEVNKRDYKSNEEWKADQAKVTATYMESVPYLEKSLELRPNDFTTVETLKVLTFRLRDEDGMMAKYEKYNKLYEELKAKQPQQ